MKYKKYVAGKYTRARAPSARKYTNRIFESKDGLTSMKIVNSVNRHNLCLNDLLTKSNPSPIGTSCTYSPENKQIYLNKRPSLYYPRLRLLMIAFNMLCLFSGSTARRCPCSNARLVLLRRRRTSWSSRETMKLMRKRMMKNKPVFLINK